MKKITVIIPVYNMEGLVSEGVGYVTGQTYENLEIIIIDDGSKDDTYKRCLAEADKDKRITVFSTNNKGPASARNMALRKATGDYVYFFDMDDALRSDAMETLVKTLEDNDADLAVCSFECYDGKRVTRTIRKRGNYVRSCSEAKKDYAEHLKMYDELGIQGAPWYKLYKMSIIREYGIEFPNLRYGEDDVFIASYVSHSERFALTGEVLCRYYINNCRRFWDKYRFDMFDTAAEHTRLMLDIVGGWNKDNKEVYDILYRDYFQKTFAGLCVLFNPHMKLTRKQRMARIREISDKFASDMPKEGFSIGHKVYEYMLTKNYLGVYIRILLHVTRHRFD